MTGLNAGGTVQYAKCNLFPSTGFYKMAKVSLHPIRIHNVIPGDNLVNIHKYYFII